MNFLKFRHKAGKLSFRFSFNNFFCKIRTFSCLDPNFPLYSWLIVACECVSNPDNNSFIWTVARKSALSGFDRRMNSWVCISAYVSACSPQHNNDNWPIRWQREALTPGAQAEPDETWQNNETETGRMQINWVSLSYILNYKKDTVQGRNKRSSFWKMLWHCSWKPNTNSCWVPHKFTQKLKLFSFQYFVLCNKAFLVESHNGSQLLINNKPWIYCMCTQAWTFELMSSPGRFQAVEDS